MRFEQDDGGRAMAGYKGDAGDCACRAVAIATGRPYQDVYHALNEVAKTERRVGQGRKRSNSSARNGYHRETLDRYLAPLGWRWVPTMSVGAGCTTHLRADELPSGRLIVRVSRHFCAVVNGVIHDTHDPSRGGARCVYGYWTRRA